MSPRPPASPFSIVCDTREQRPLRFDPSVVVVRETMAEGDYTTPPLAGRVAIERKSLPDLVASISRDRDRFFRELVRLSTYDFRAVVVEGSLAQIMAGAYRARVHPNAVLGSVCKIIADLRTPVVFADDATTAARVVEKLLRRLEGTVVQHRGAGS